MDWIHYFGDFQEVPAWDLGLRLGDARIGEARGLDIGLELG